MTVLVSCFFSPEMPFFFFLLFRFKQKEIERSWRKGGRKETREGGRKREEERKMEREKWGRRIGKKMEKRKLKKTNGKV